MLEFQFWESYRVILFDVRLINEFSATRPFVPCTIAYASIHLEKWCQMAERISPDLSDRTSVNLWSSWQWSNSRDLIHVRLKDATDANVYVCSKDNVQLAEFEKMRKSYPGPIVLAGTMAVCFPREKVGPLRWQWETVSIIVYTTHFFRYWNNITGRGIRKSVGKNTEKIHSWYAFLLANVYRVHHRTKRIINE